MFRTNKMDFVWILRQIRRSYGRTMEKECFDHAPFIRLLWLLCLTVSFSFQFYARTLSHRHQRHPSMAIVCRLNTFIAIVIIARWACNQTLNATLNVLIFECYKIRSICLKWLNYNNNCAMGFLLILCIANLWTNLEM